MARGIYAGEWRVIEGYSEILQDHEERLHKLELKVKEAHDREMYADEHFSKEDRLEERLNRLEERVNMIEFYRRREK